MTKLKTLKDFEDRESYIYFSGEERVRMLDERLLKSEAVKWVKEIKGFGNKYPLRFSTNFIKHFFNLTSEDLK